MHFLPDFRNGQFFVTLLLTLLCFVTGCLLGYFP